MPISLRKNACRFWAATTLPAALLLMTAHSLAWGQGPLTLADALRIAEARAPTLAASTAAAQGAREMAVAAGQLPDPVFRAGVDNLPVNGPDAFSLERDFMTMRRVGLMQEYVSTDKREARQQRDMREARRFEAEGEMSRSEVKTDVASIWYDRLFAKRAEALLQGLADELGMQQRAIEAQIASGKAVAADALAARALAIQTQDKITTVRRQQQASTARLERWLGDAAQRTVSDDTAGPSETELTALAAHESHDLHDIPHLRLLATQVAVADADVTVAEQNRTPNWSWEIAYAQRGPSYSNMISVGVSVPIPINRGSRQDRELAARLAQRDQARDLLEDARRRHNAAFNALRIDWQSLTDRERELQASLLPVVQQRADAQLAAYRGGQQNLGAVLEARRAEVDARLQILDLERDAAHVWSQLEYTYLDAGTERMPPLAGARP